LFLHEQAGTTPNLVKSCIDRGFLPTLRLTPTGPNPYISEAEKSKTLQGLGRQAGRVGAVSPTKAAHQTRSFKNASEGAHSSMRNRRETVSGLLFAAALAVLVLTGCRAFQPEAVIVNKAPETFIIGAPVEHGGGYYRFHVFWYGSDVDGRVERFVWALTDTTVQDDDTTDDEEDVRFNPALDASTLDIGRWTTRTDSIFNFTIDQGVQPSYDMTLHMVAVDDFGDFDRTPARLHFFSNTLGNPVITFFQVIDDSLIAVPQGQADTVGFAVPYQVHWEGISPNIRGYSPEALAMVDTVPEFTDGMLGFKYRLMGELGGNCVPSLTDCWSPRIFQEATGDSISVFALRDRDGNVLPPVQDLIFLNDPLAGPEDGPFEKLLPSGAVNLEVNSIDIAGVEVSSFLRPFTFVVNFDPETIMLDGETDWAHPEDPESYPYYILLNDDTQEHHPFQSGDRIPDRTYVVAKSLARDNPKDTKLDPNFKIGISGFLQGTRHNYFGGRFSFTSESSVVNTEPPWDANEDGWYADTLGFLTGPRTTFTINMQAVDEHGRKDGSPANLSFDVGHPPCIQCIELLPKFSTPSGYDESLECLADTTSDAIDAHPCFSDTTILRVTSSGLGDDELQFIQPVFMLVDRSTGFTWVVIDPPSGGENEPYVIESNLYRMEILLHGLDDIRERWEDKVRRIMGWAYQVDYECDPFNQIRDGGGNDDIKVPTWGRSGNSEGITIDAATGLWKISVDVAVPRDLITLGPDLYKDLTLQYIVGIDDPDMRDRVFNDSTKQFGKGRVQAIALDQTQCGFSPTRPATYNFFRNVRPSQAELPPGRSWRDCDLKDSGVTGIQLTLDISPGAMASLDGWAASQFFRIVIETAPGDFECHSSDGF